MVWRKIFIVFFIATLFSCNAQNDVTSTIYEDIGKMQCLGNEQHVIYFSKPAELQSKRPLIIAIDAQGRGEMAVRKLVEACAFTPAIIVGSNAIKNGHPNFQEAIDDIINTSISTFIGRNSIDLVDENSIYLVGFSGGARMAFNYAQNHNIKGIVMIGADHGPDLPDYNTYVICGNKDFNFMESYRRPIMQMLDDGIHVFDQFNGGHEWPDSASLTDAMLFQLAYIDDFGQQIAERRAKKMMLESDSILNSGRALMAWKNLEKSYKFTRNEILRAEIREKAIAMLANEKFNKIIYSNENNLKLEMNERQSYIESSLVEDRAYWKKEITKLRETSMYSSNTQEIEHSNRMLGFLGILFYSRIKTAMISEVYLDQSKVLIDAFEILEPKNPDMLYFKALYFTQTSQMDSASHFLALARQNGFKE